MSAARQPRPEAAAAAPLADKLRRRIAAEGPLSVATYMEACLADPEQGYYRGRDPLGARGDFITAPEISQIFGELIGLWCVEVWRDMGAPAPFLLVELGPGRGTLMADALRAGAVAPDFAAAARLHLVETSPVLRANQAERLGRHGPVWHERLADVPQGPAVVIANEFVDTLPVRQFVRTPDGWRERCVGAAAAGFVFRQAAGVLSEASIIPAPIREAAGLGDIAEIRPGAEALAAELGARAAAHPAAALVIDYGHTRSAPGDTLQAVAGHGYADTLQSPGMCDLSAHVDFEQLALAARERGLAAHGPISQGRFLLALGLAARCRRLMKGATPEQASLLQSGAQRLVDPAAMGSLFKVLALTSAAQPPPPPFGDEKGDEPGNRC